MPENGFAMLGCFRLLLLKSFQKADFGDLQVASLQ